MIKFDKEILNELCAELLSPDGNRLKMAESSAESFVIGVDERAIGLLENRRWQLLETLGALDKALLISKLAQELGAHLLEI